MASRRSHDPQPSCPRGFRPWLLLVCALAAQACGGGLRLNRVEAAYRKPSNVAVFFSVEESDGEPVADLLASDFNIYEDGSLVSVDESQQTIVNPEIAASHHTLLLVDMSASVTESDQVAMIVDAASAFVTTVEGYQEVGVHAFDGSSEIHQITPFTKSDARASRGLSKLAQFSTRDPSTNLHGAVVEALDKLDKALSRSKVPLRFGTLVVFTDGTDRAARVSFQEMVDQLGASDHAIFAIGVGNEIDDTTLSRIGRTGYIRVEDTSALHDAFSEIGERIVRFTRRYYLLSYCSPARAGKHMVTIEAVSGDDSGQLQYEFDAKGFAPGCDPSRPPPFDTTGRTRRTRKKLELDQKPKSE